MTQQLAVILRSEADLRRAYQQLSDDYILFSKKSNQVLTNITKETGEYSVLKASSPGPLQYIMALIGAPALFFNVTMLCSQVQGRLWWAYLTGLLATHVVADLCSGLGHLYFDVTNFSYTNSILDKIRCNFRIHHITARSMEYNPWIEILTDVSVFTTPILWLPVLCDMHHVTTMCVLFLAFWLFCIQISHRFVHRRTTLTLLEKNIRFSPNMSAYIPWPWKVLQDSRVFLCNSHHKQHHTTEIENFCILSGITSPLIDAVIRYLDIPLHVFRRDGTEQEWTYVKNIKGFRPDEKDAFQKQGNYADADIVYGRCGQSEGNRCETPARVNPHNPLHVHTCGHPETRGSRSHTRLLGDQLGGATNVGS